MSSPEITVKREIHKINPQKDNSEVQSYVLLGETAMALRPAGFAYLGSFAVHIYQSDITRSIDIRVQKKDMFEWTDETGVKGGVSGQIALAAIKEAERYIQDSYFKKKRKE